jgi:hypothetical protein
MMRKPRQKRSDAGTPSHDFVLTALERLNREKAELLEEVRQLRAAVSIYKRIAEHVTGNPLPAGKIDAA